ncbi:GNAT family N-acetyltransferase [Kiloniella antarctica]|uniref:GNAT family N-acetyltransferase n=1 Tax=Kiloniella antarctica TaxID=1550907 RepID=A0ABW5BHF5_9PROT
MTEPIYDLIPSHSVIQVFIMHINENGQPIGAPVNNWSERLLPPLTKMEGIATRLEILDTEKHAQDLFEANKLDMTGQIWGYLSYGPYSNLTDYKAWVSKYQRKADPLFYAILDKATNKALGVASYLRVSPTAGSIEVGHINFSPALQQTIIATEAMYLMMRRVFTELGYRRYEWKCNALNEGSKAAAKRLGFTYEGTFRQADINKGRNRDTAWFSIINSEWPAIEEAFEAWLSPDNFDAKGKQKTSLSKLTQDALSKGTL